MDLGIALEGFFFEKVNGSTGQRVTFTFHYIIYAPASCHTLQRLLLLAAAESNSAPFARRVLHCISTVYIGGPWGVLFLKGQRVDGSTGQWVKRVDGSHLDGVCRWTSQLPLRGSLSKRSTGRRVNESRVKRIDGSTGHFHFHYIIYDSRRRQAHATPLQKAHGVWWHQAHATPRRVNLTSMDKLQQVCTIVVQKLWAFERFSIRLHIYIQWPFSKIF